MKIVAITSVALVVVLFSFLIFRDKAGCQGDPDPVEGIVTGKHWFPAHDDLHMMLIPDGNNGFTQIPIWDHYPDEYWIYCGQRKCRVVSQDFKQIEIGQYFKERK